MLATERWRQMIEVEHAQSDEMRGAVPPPTDHWRPESNEWQEGGRAVREALVDKLRAE